MSASAHDHETMTDRKGTTTMSITANTETDTKTDSMSGTAAPLVFHIMFRDTERALCGETVRSRSGHAHGKGEPPATMAWNYCPLCWEECKRRLHKTDAELLAMYGTDPRARWRIN